MFWTVYILECCDGSLYTGVTNDLVRRLAQHNEGKGAKYTASRLPVRQAWAETGHTRETALQREYAIKRLSRKQKLEMIFPNLAVKSASLKSVEFVRKSSPPSITH